MPTWNHKVKLKHLFTREEDHKSVKESMKAIADELKKHECFRSFDSKAFYKIKKGDEVISALDYANTLINRLYNYADDNRIWID